MPLTRRVPKFGFTNRFRKEFQVINVSRLQELIDEKKFEDNKVNLEVLYSIGAIAKRNLPLKVLGNGEISSPINVEANKFTASAKQKIESAGGTVTLNE